MLLFMTHSHKLRPSSATSSDVHGPKAVLQAPSRMHRTLILQVEDRCITFRAGPHSLSDLNLEGASRRTTVLSSVRSSTCAVILLGVPNSGTHMHACSFIAGALQKLAVHRHHAWTLNQHMPRRSFYIATHTGRARTHLEGASRHTMRLSSESLSTYDVTLPGIRSLGTPATQARYRNPHIHARLFVDCALQATAALENRAWNLHQRAKTSSGLCPPAAIGANHILYLSPEGASRRSRLSHSCNSGARQCCFRASYLHVQSLCAGCPRDSCANHMLHHHILHLCLGVASRPMTTFSPAGSFARAVVLPSIRSSGAHSQHTCTSNPSPEDASRTMRTSIQQWLHGHALDSLARSGTASTHPYTPVVKARCTDHGPHECKFHACALQAVAIDEDHFSDSDQGGTLHCHPHLALTVENVHIWAAFHPSWHDPQRAKLSTARVGTPFLSQVSREVASALQGKALRNTHAGPWLYLTLDGEVMYLPARPEGASDLDLPYWHSEWTNPENRLLIVINRTDRNFTDIDLQRFR